MRLSEQDIFITKIHNMTHVNSNKQELTKPVNNRPSYCIVYKLSGKIRYELNERELISTADDIVFLAKGSDYAVNMLEHGECIAINFDIFASPKLKSFVIHPQNYQKLKKNFLTLEHLYLTRMRNGDLKFLSLMYEILSEVDNCLRFRRISEANINKIVEACKYIEENFARTELRITDVAKKFSMSPARFYSVFTDAYGIPPLQYLNNIRLNVVKQLLVGSTLSLDEIALKSGFADYHYLSRLFTKNIGISPSAYRSQSRHDV